MKKEKKFEITKKMTIGQVAELGEKVQTVLLGFGLHCFGCPMANMETVAQAAKAHGLDLKLFLEKLNAALI